MIMKMFLSSLWPLLAQLSLFLFAGADARLTDQHLRDAASLERPEGPPVASRASGLPRSTDEEKPKTPSSTHEDGAEDHFAATGGDETDEVVTQERPRL
ncbi:unnamed protein product, partial [Amoebophrya sp. A120]|eukprot:GSA120T00002750001.1